MKVKMRETYQSVSDTAVLFHEGITVSTLEVDEVYLVNDTLGKWLIENNKADEVKAPVHYGAQAEAEYPRNDEEKYKIMTGENKGEFEPLPEVTGNEPESVAKVAKPKRGRKG